MSLNDSEESRKVLMEAHKLAQKALPFIGTGFFSQNILLDEEKIQEDKHQFEKLIQKCKKALKKQTDPTLKKQWEDALSAIKSLEANSAVYDADLEQMPEPLFTKTGAILTIGDLHGNALKFLYFLIREGILKLDTNLNHATAKYNKLLDIYNNENLNKTDIEEFNKIIESNELIWNPDLSIRLLGDETGDRGANDYLTLKIIEQLDLHKVPIEIVLSNHGLELLEHYENDFKETGRGMGPDQAKSVYKAMELIEKNIITKETLDKLVTEHYLPNLKALSYTLYDKFSPPHIAIFTHAPVGLKTIQSLAETFEIPCEEGIWDKSARSIAKTIDQINEAFSKRAKSKGEITYMMLQDGYYYHMAESAPLSAPLLRITWTRREFDGNKDKRLPGKENSQKGYDYTTSYAHGHDGGGVVQQDEAHYVRNLDNNLGKDLRYAGMGKNNQEYYFISCEYI